jgi:uncharacterized phage protein (TIGR01671 family)
MREIKFRLWSDSLKVMYSPDNQIPDLWSIHEADNGIIKVNKGDILMQFTGLLDKKRKEIYEGDIIRHLQGEQEKELYEFKGVVKFQNGAFIIYAQNGYRSNLCFYDMLGSNQILWCWHGAHGNPDHFYIAKDFEVIGNIYSNPELLS